MSGVVSLANVETRVAERDGQGIITVVRNGDTSREAVVTYDITADTATVGTDCVAQSGDVRIPAGAN
ncbi:MAG: hypothetical protein AAF922_10505 [Pseudomonadota bacterium]